MVSFATIAPAPSSAAARHGLFAGDNVRSTRAQPEVRGASWPICARSRQRLRHVVRGQALAMSSRICSSWAMHSFSASHLNLTALSARSFVLAVSNNNRANNNANRWRARA